MEPTLIETTAGPLPKLSRAQLLPSLMHATMAEASVSTLPALLTLNVLFMLNWPAAGGAEWVQSKCQNGKKR